MQPNPAPATTPATAPWLRGIWVPLVTPFTADGAVDHAGLARLLDHLDVHPDVDLDAHHAGGEPGASTSRGLAGLVVCGTTGEAAALSPDEQFAVLRQVLAHRASQPAARRWRVMMGLSATTPAEAQAQLAALARCLDAPSIDGQGHQGGQTGGATLDAVLVPAPSYVRPSQAGLLAYFRAVADASPWPVVVYDIPARTGVALHTATLLDLADHPHIVGVKDCAGDLDHTQALIADGRLQLLAGDDARVLASLCLGAAGAIAASAHLAPAAFVRLQALVDAGQLGAARTLWQRLWPLTRALFAEPNPAPVKAGLAQRLGLAEHLRAPMTPASAACAAQVAEGLARIELLDGTGRAGSMAILPGLASG